MWGDVPTGSDLGTESGGSKTDTWAEVLYPIPRNSSEVSSEQLSESQSFILARLSKIYCLTDMAQFTILSLFASPEELTTSGSVLSLRKAIPSSYRGLTTALFALLK